MLVFWRSQEGGSVANRAATAGNRITIINSSTALTTPPEKMTPPLDHSISRV